MPKFFPAFLDIHGRKCVVIGGGNVAERKVESMTRCGGVVTVISPDLTPGLAERVRRNEIQYISERFREEHLAGAYLIIAATDDMEVNTRASAEANRRKIPINVVDVPDQCTFIVPSILERGDLVVAVSTSGASPAAAGFIRRELESYFGPEYGEFLELMKKLRERVKREVDDFDERGEIFKRLVRSDILKHLKNDDMDKVNEEVERILSQ
jgi:precorrin-2 dehydrogenase/sirohydrochlorin ferrochelatase